MSDSSIITIIFSGLLFATSLLQVVTFLVGYLLGAAEEF